MMRPCPRLAGVAAMGRAVACFAFGLLFGFLAIYFLCQGALLLAEGDDMTAASRRGMSLAEYQIYLDGRFGQRFLLLALGGGIICGAALAVASRPTVVRAA